MVDDAERARRAIVVEELDASGLVKPTPGRIVWYQTDGRNDLDYILPAIVTMTKDTHAGDYPDGTPNGLAPPSSEMHVHLTVFTPGGFGSTYGDAVTWDQVQQEELANLGYGGNVIPGSGTYVERDVPYDADGGRRSWRWPERS